jgi:predicted O-methyltransferase YrrM
MPADFIFNDIFSRTNTKKFIQHFAQDDNWHNLDMENGDLGYGLIHYSLIRLIKPKRVLCVGSRYGYIPAICALACKDNKQGVVDFVDAAYDQTTGEDENHWGGVGFWKTQKGKDHFRKFGLQKHVKLHVMTTAEFKKKYPKRRWGYIHIDGDHSYKGVKFDFQSFWPKLLGGGFLALHDIFTKDLGGLEYGVEKLWQELKKEKKHNCMEFPGECGLGIVQKQSGVE